MTKNTLDAQHNYTECPAISFFVMHTHEQYELFSFLRGDAKYYVEGTVYNLKPGDILVMKKGEAHTLLMKSEVPYERIVIYFGENDILCEMRDALLSFLRDRELGSANRYPASMFHNRHWQEYLDRIVHEQDKTTKRLYLTMLLSELHEAQSLLKTEGETSDVMKSLIIYINQNLRQDLTLDALSEKFFISKSYITRKFKQITGASVHEYIRTKRLLMAKDLLQQGETSMTVAEHCGFKEYTSFYTAYKKKFGVSPKEDRLRRPTDKSLEI